MGWDGVDFDWNQARAFLATAEEGSLSAAARALKQTQPTLGRQVAALEEHLGVVLFERVGRKLSLTPSGLDLLEHVRAMRDAAQRVSLSASGHAHGVDGLVRITASDVFAAHLLPDALKRLRQLAPELEIDIVASNALQDLQRREADIAIRHVRPTQPHLIARLVQEATAHLCGARAYLDARGRPESPDDLIHHDFVAFGDIDRMLGYFTEFGFPIRRSNVRMGSENGMVAWELVRRGFGLGVMADAVAIPDPDIELVLPSKPAITFPVWLTTHRELHTSRRIRLVFDTLADFLGSSGR